MSRICESERDGKCFWTHMAREDNYLCTKRPPIKHCRYLKGYSERLKRMNKWRQSQRMDALPIEQIAKDGEA